MTEEERRRRARAYQNSVRNPFAAPVRGAVDAAAAPLRAISALFGALTTPQIRQATQPNPLRPAPAGTVFDLKGRLDQAGRGAGRAVMDAVRSPTNPVGLLNFLTTGLDQAPGAARAAGPALGFEAPKPAAAASGARPQAFSPPDMASALGVKAPQRGSGVGQLSVDALRPHFVQQESSGNYKARNAETGAMGAYQVMPTTGQALAKRLGLPWQPGLMTQDSPEARAYQDRIGGAAIQEAIGASGGDLSTAAMYYHGGPNKAGWGPKTQQYARDMLGRVGGAGAPGGMMNPFDAAAPMWGQALAANDQATALQMQPIAFEQNRPDGPQMPDPLDLPDRDFTKTDELLKQMRPVLIGEVEAKKLQRANLFEGLAKGLMSLPDGAGLGQVLGNLGAGLAAGRAAGDREVQARMDKFDEKMAAWQMMEFKYESGKADTLHDDAVTEITSMYQHNMKKFEIDTRQYEKDWGFDVQGNYVVARSKTDGGVKVNMIPLAPVIQAEGAIRRATILGQAAGAAQSGAGMIASANNQLVISDLQFQRQLERTQANGVSSDPALNSFVNSAGLQAAELFRSGVAANILGEAYDEVVKAARQQAMNEGQMTNPSERIEELIIGQLTSAMLNNPEFRKQALQRGPQLWESFKRRELEEERRTRTIDAKGRISERVTN